MNLLSIGGSDPSTGAGIQSDVRIFSKLGAHSLTVITAVTGQNTSKFGMSEPVSNKILKNQLDMILSDFKIDGIKIGMVYSSAVIKILFDKLKNLKTPIVVDPVIRATTGGVLLKKSAIKDFRKYIIPLATVITPNKHEAEILSKEKISNQREDVFAVARKIQDMGVRNVIITGIEKKGKSLDFVLEEEKEHVISANSITGTNHGSGCTFSAALLFAIAKSSTIKESSRFAKKVTLNAITNAKRTGKGIAITIFEDDNDNSTKSELEKAIEKFTKIKNIYRNIPECQTNFVNSKDRPKTTKDILGIAGRIVKSGNKVVMAGELRYGGSKHVATSVLEVNKKFPQIHSAINLKYQEPTIRKISESGMITASYDRRKEPKDAKSTVEWGTKEALKESGDNIPDVIFHKGDFGKEPMIIVFGENPKKVLQKVTKII